MLGLKGSRRSERQFQGVVNGFPHLVHSIRRKGREVTYQQVLVDRRDIVERDGASGWHAIVRFEDDLRVEPSDRPRQRRYRRVVEFGQGVVAGQDQDRTPPQRIGQIGPPDLSLRFIGHREDSIPQSLPWAIPEAGVAAWFRSRTMIRFPGRRGRKGSLPRPLPTGTANVSSDRLEAMLQFGLEFHVHDRPRAIFRFPPKVSPITGLTSNAG